MTEQFLYQYHPGPRPELVTDRAAWTDADNAVYERHVAHLESGVEEGIVVMAGRCQDGIGPAIVIVEVESEDAARAFMEADPFVSDGLFEASLHPYRVAFTR